MSPGRAWPRSALRFAPSQYMSAPASCAISAISSTCVSNSPRVFGLVSMIAATSSPSTSLSASGETRPSSSEVSTVTSQPQRATDAGLVPCAVSGTITRLLAVSPCESCHARKTRSDVNSPAAPAGGWRETENIIRIFRRPAREKMTRSDVNSPAAPAGGWRETASIPRIAASHVSRSRMSRSAPCMHSSGVAGCSRAQPGSAAIASLARGLYFIVQEPSG